MKKTHLALFISAGLIFVGALPLPAIQPPERPPLPNLDQRQAGAVAAAATPERAAAAAALVARVPGAHVAHDELLGTAKFVASTRGFLTGPDGQAGALSASFLQRH